MTSSDLLVIDFETYDPHLDKLGSGWVHGDIEVIGASLYKPGWKEPRFYTNKDHIMEYVNNTSTLVAHNLQYDVGILFMWGLDPYKYKLIDTMIMAKLVCNIHSNYSLNGLANYYFGDNKSDMPLALAAIRHRIHKVSKRKKPRTDGWKGRTIKSAMKTAKTRMDELWKVRPDLVTEYANHDTWLTWKLYKYFEDRVDPLWLDRCSRMFPILLKCRNKGVPIDISRLHEVRDILRHKENMYLDTCEILSRNDSFNPNSPKQMKAAMDMYQIRYEYTQKGNPSLTSQWLAEQDHPLCNAIHQYRKYNKARRDFCDAVLEAQELLPEEKRGRVYPEFKLFGARTGRFSCSKPNIQQIPGRDEEIGPLIRSIYVPEPATAWYSLDFSSQETRLQAHYAHLTHAAGASEFVRRYVAEPDMDVHQMVADIANIERSQAKTINLGLSYGMGKKKLCTALGLPLKAGMRVIAQYNRALPFIKDLSKKCADALKKQGYIRTLGGRQSKLEPVRFCEEEERYKSFEYRGMNKLIQGSAADQVIIAMLEIDKAGIDVLFSVHDEINLCSSNREDALKVQNIMENCVELVVPMIAEIGEGTSWSEAK